MVTQRTTLMSISFASILISLNKPENCKINILWTGVEAQYSHVKWGLIFVLALYLVGYIWKWFCDNPEKFIADLDVIDNYTENFEKSYNLVIENFNSMEEYEEMSKFRQAGVFNAYTEFKKDGKIILNYMKELSDKAEKIHKAQTNLNQNYLKAYTLVIPCITTISAIFFLLLN